MDLVEQIKELEQKYEILKGNYYSSVAMCDALKVSVKEALDQIGSTVPTKVYTHKGRGNTTVKFADGSSVTVKKKKGEKDCIETAIAYCIMKQIISPKTLRKLIEEREQH